MKNISQIIIFLLLLFACKAKNNDDLTEKWKQEIRQVEKDFSEMSQKKGIHDAFMYYAAEDAVLKRDSLIIGKENIDKHLKNSKSRNLSWTPSFVDVSSSGDIGYTYGTYTFAYKDSLGKSQKDIGLFHTVWKRQDNGLWKFVYD